MIRYSNWTIKSLVEEFISDEDEIEEFGKWAFGENYLSLYGTLNFMKAWNRFHENELSIKESGDVYDDMKKNG